MALPVGSDVMDENICSSCPKVTPGCLPGIILQAAAKGSVKEVKDWLDKGGDVNEGNQNCVTLLSTACYEGQIDVVKELLKHQDLHLNLCYLEMGPPVVQAAFRGRLDIMQLLFNSSLKCRVNINKFSCSGLPAISYAINNNHWRVVDLLLEHQPNITRKDANSGMHRAIAAGEWGVVLAFLQRDDSHQGSNLSGILGKAYVHEEWEVLGEVFRKIISYNNDVSLPPISNMLENRDWKSLEFVLKYVEDSVSVNSSLVKAMLAKRKKEVEAMLEKEEGKKEVVNATLLIACIGGTSEEIADVLVSQTCYSKQVLDYSLIFAAIFNRLEVLPLLLVKNKFSCQTISRAREMASYFKHKDSALLLKEAFSKATKDILQLDELSPSED